MAFSGADDEGNQAPSYVGQSVYSDFNPLRWLPGLNAIPQSVVDTIEEKRRKLREYYDVSTPQRTPGEKQRMETEAAYSQPAVSSPYTYQPTGMYGPPAPPAAAMQTGTPPFTAPSPPTPAKPARPAGATVIPSTYFSGANEELTPEQQYENALALSQKYAPKGDDDYAQALKALSEKRASRIEGMESTARGLAALQAAAAMGKSLTFGQGIGAAAGAFGSAYGAQKQRIEAAQDAADSATAEYQKYKTALSEGRRKEAFTAYEKATDNAFQAKKLGVEAQYWADANRAKMLEAQAHMAHYGSLDSKLQRAELSEYGKYMREELMGLDRQILEGQKALTQPMTPSDKQELKNNLLLWAEQRKQKASEIAGIFATLGYGPQAAQQGITKPTVSTRAAQYGS